MLIRGDLFDVLPTLDAESIESCVTDPPYGIGFMGKQWDSFSPSVVKSEFDLRQRQEFKDGVTSANIKGRTRTPAASPSQIQYNRSLEGQRGFQDWTARWGAEVFRVLKPGAHLVVCGAPRSHHRMMCGLEDAGFEVRDCLAWIFGSGFPKSSNFGCRCETEPTTERDVRRVPDADVSSAVDAGAEPAEVLHDGMPEQGLQRTGPSGHRQARARERVVEGRRHVQTEQGELHRPQVSPVSGGVPGDGADGRLRDGASARRGAAVRSLFTEDGSGSPSGPQHTEQRGRQPRTIRQQPSTQTGRGCCETCGGLIGYRGWGTALKPGHEPIVLARKPFRGTLKENVARYGVGGLNVDACRIEHDGDDLSGGNPLGKTPGTQHEGWQRPWMSDDAKRAAYQERKLQGEAHAESLGRWPANVLLDAEAAEMLDAQTGELTSGDYSGARQSDKTRGVYGTFAGTGPRMEGGHVGDSGGASRFFYVAKPSREERDYGTTSRNVHPTVKPIELMRWLVRLVTPLGGTVLDPFLGSGTTGMACRYELREFIGIEREAEYVQIAERRIGAVVPLFHETA